MTDTREDRIFDIIDRWSHLEKEGEAVSVEELCRDCPTLIEAVKERIEALQATAWLERQVEDDFNDNENRLPQEYGLPEQLGRYRLISSIGEGGFGQVWKAHDPELHRDVAIKLPRPDRVLTDRRTDEFIQEARRVAQLKHPGIVSIHDVGVQDGIGFIVSDYIVGKNLASVIEQEQLSIEQAIQIVSEVGTILLYAHEQGYVHRDVKPSNILVGDNGRYFLTDFGISATVEELSAGNHNSAGTLSYMSPEQISGDMIDHRTDIYSLGVVFHELLTGHKPHEKEHSKAQIPNRLRSIMNRCLANNPDDRFASAKEFVGRLKKHEGKKSSIGRRWSGMIVFTLAIAAIVWLTRTNENDEITALPSTSQPMATTSPEPEVKDSPNSPEIEPVTSTQEDDVDFSTRHQAKIIQEASYSNNPQRRVAELILRVGGNFYLRGGSKPINRLDDLPGTYQVAVVWLRESRIQDEDIPAIAAVSSIWTINFTGSPLSDQGLWNLSGMKSLKELRLNETQITDQGLEALTGLSNLKLLELRNTKVSDQGMRHLAKISSLREVVVVGTKVSPKGKQLLRDHIPGVQIR